MARFLKIDEEGYFLSDDGLRLDDPQFAKEVFENLERGEWGSWKTTIGSTEVLLEAFDEPLVARQIVRHEDKWLIQAPYGWTEQFVLEELRLDEWDRFHGWTARKVPFVMSRPAQSEFFNLLDDFDDDSITSNGQTHFIPPWLDASEHVSTTGFWTDLYKGGEQLWDQNAPNATLEYYLPTLKLSRSHVAVPGCGRGHDANYFAEQGHITSAFDFADQAILEAGKKYQHRDLKFYQQDVFDLGSTHREKFDVVFEHTLYCAIDPDRRNELVNVWRQILRPGGFLIGVFFAMDKTFGPPFGGSEWEIRQRLKKHFDFLCWVRSRHSTERRLGKEVFIMARLKPKD